MKSSFFLVPRVVQYNRQVNGSLWLQEGTAMYSRGGFLEVDLSTTNNSHLSCSLAALGEVPPNTTVGNLVHEDSSAPVWVVMSF